jgi:hypothetical protein
MGVYVLCTDDCNLDFTVIFQNYLRLDLFNNIILYLYIAVCNVCMNIRKLSHEITGLCTIYVTIIIISTIKFNRHF